MFEKLKAFLGDTRDYEVKSNDDNEIEETSIDKTKPKFVLRKPESRAELAEIAQDLTENRIVILNLELINKSEVRRFLDFLQGTIFALNGQVKKLSDDTYIFIPGSVEVKGDILEDVEKLM